MTDIEKKIIKGFHELTTINSDTRDFPPLSEEQKQQLDENREKFQKGFDARVANKKRKKGRFSS